MSSILTLSCKDRPGIVAAVTTTLSNHQCNIEESSQFRDPASNLFYMRVVFKPAQAEFIKNFCQNFNQITKKFDMTWRISDAQKLIKTLLLVSGHDHCLNDILYRCRSKGLPIDITAVASNHDITRSMVEQHSIPFYYLPICKESKQEQESKIRALIKETDTDLIIMARYMQILSTEFCQDYAGRIINIHHSFLPGFKGAKPYHQAYNRGVKMIGATAHFATDDLDEGPIITQNVTCVSHSDTPDIMKNLGKDIECQTLAQAITLYAQHRVFTHGRRTIIL